MADSYTTTATLSNKKTLVLDEPVPMAGGRVRVTIEQLPETQSGVNLLERLSAIHRALQASGYRPHTREEIDAQIRAERDSWGE